MSEQLQQQSASTVHSTLEDSTSSNVEVVGDDVLIMAYKRGDANAFETLYARHKKAVYGFFARQLPYAQANDGFQETWSKFLSAIHAYQAQGTFTAYIFRIAHNVLMDHHRMLTKEGLTDTLLEEIPAPNADPAGELSRDELRTLLYRELAKLPIAQRSVWVLKQESQLSLPEIAKLTESNVEGVKSRLRYANEKLTLGMQRYVRS